MAITKELLDEVGKAFAGDVAAMDRLFPPDITMVEGSTALQGPAGVKGYFTTFSRAFPDASIQIRNAVVHEDEAGLEVVYSGSHTGPLAGPQGEVPPTGRKVTSPGAAFVRLRGDKLVSFHGYYDQLGFMVQLGLMPAPAAA